MPTENVDLARELYAGRKTDLAAIFRDPELLAAFRAALADRITEDFELVSADGAVPMAGGGLSGAASASGDVLPVSHGPDGFVEVWRDWLSAWSSWTVTPADFVVVDDERVIVALEIRAHSKTHGAEFVFDAANVLTFREGKLSRLELYSSRARAFERAGL